MMGMIMASTAAGKRPTNVSLDLALVGEARTLGLNVSQACENGLRGAVDAARRQQWRAENAAALAASNAYVDAHGLPLGTLRQF